MKKLIMLCLLSFFFLHGSAFGAFNFIDNGDGTVTDARTGLVWLKNCSGSSNDWGSAMSYCAQLASGMAGLTDGSIAGQWRLPNREEIEGIGTDPPATWFQGFPSVNWTMPDEPFLGVNTIHRYWTSESADSVDCSCAYFIFILNGNVEIADKSNYDGFFAWPVRDVGSSGTTTILLTSTTIQPNISTTSSTTTVTTTSTTVLATTTTTAQGCVGISDPWPADGSGSELNLYQIFNQTFNQNLTSSNQLATLYGLPDNLDEWWESINQGGSVQFTVRYASFGQELGIQPLNGTYQALVTNIPEGQQNTSVVINTPAKFAFVEQANGGSGNGGYTWYSVVSMNPIQDGDHFKAFKVTDLYNSTFFANVSQAWLIAFEDNPTTNGSDCDYNDLVALVIEVEPTLITLSSFTAKASNGRVSLEWLTEAEINNVGFNLYRADAKNGQYTKINASLIPAQGSSTEGASYEYIDNGLQNRKTYYYKLEDIDLSGKSTLHGPVNATPRLIYGIGK